MENVKFALPQWAIDTAAEGLQELARRLADDAAAFARLDTPEGRALAAERLAQACKARKGSAFYLNL